MSKLRLELNSKGVRTLLKSREMQSIVKRKAEEMGRKSGKGYKTSVYVGKTRVNASVTADTKRAMLDNSENNTLLKNAR